MQSVIHVDRTGADGKVCRLYYVRRRDKGRNPDAVCG
jgi:hypothetical protein